MGYVVKASDGTGGSGWITRLDAEGIRSIGTLGRAQVFRTHEDAQQEIDRLSDHLPTGAIRLKIELE